MTTDIEELLEQAQAMQEAEDLKNGSNAGGLLSKSAGEMVKDISDPTRLVTLYATATGEPRPVPVWTLEGKNSILLRKNPDGTKVFATKKPKDVKWELGNVPCLLNPKHPDFEKYRDEVGIQGEPCRSEHLKSTFSQRRHMINKHSHEWETIQSYETQVRDQENRDYQRAMARAAQASMPKDK